MASRVLSIEHMTLVSANVATIECLVLPLATAAACGSGCANSPRCGLALGTSAVRRLPNLSGESFAEANKILKSFS